MSIRSQPFDHFNNPTSSIKLQDFSLRSIRVASTDFQDRQKQELEKKCLHSSFVVLIKFGINCIQDYFYIMRSFLSNRVEIVINIKICDILFALCCHQRNVDNLFTNLTLNILNTFSFIFSKINIQQINTIVFYFSKLLENKFYCVLF